MLLARYSILAYKNISGSQVQCCLSLKTEVVSIGAALPDGSVGIKSWLQISYIVYVHFDFRLKTLNFPWTQRRTKGGASVLSHTQTKSQ